MRNKALEYVPQIEFSQPSSFRDRLQVPSSPSSESSLTTWVVNSDSTSDQVCGMFFELLMPFLRSTVQQRGHVWSKIIFVAWHGFLCIAEPIPSFTVCCLGRGTWTMPCSVPMTNLLTNRCMWLRALVLQVLQGPQTRTLLVCPWLLMFLGRAGRASSTLQREVAWEETAVLTATSIIQLPCWSDVSESEPETKSSESFQRFWIHQ